MSVVEAAQELGVSVRRVRQLIETGQLRARLLSGHFYVIERESLEQFKGRRRGPGRPRRQE